MRRLDLAPAFEPLKPPFPDDCPNISGDPHILTFDGLRYDFQATGEFVALRSRSEDVLVHVRLAPAGADGRVSIVDGVAVRFDSLTLVVDNLGLTVTLDGSEVAEQAETATGNGALIVRRDSRLAVLWPDHSTAILVTGVGRRGHLNLYATLDAGRAGQVAGLLGNGDGVRDNDLALPDGTVVDHDFEAIHGLFRDAWRVAEEALLFGGPSTFDASLPPGPVEMTRAEEAAAREVCIGHGVLVTGVLENCTLDVAMTGDEGYARRYAGEQQPRVLDRAACPPGVGELVAMEGFGPAGTYATAGRLIEGEVDWEFSVEDLPMPIVRGLAATPDGVVVVDTRNGLHFTDREGRVRKTVNVTSRPHTPTVTTGRVFTIVRDGLLALSHDGGVCWRLLGYAGEQFRAVGLAGDLLVATTWIGGIGTVLMLDPETGAPVWSASFPRAIGAWAAGSGRLVVGVAGTTFALEASSGGREWAAEGGFLINALAIEGEVVYAVDLNGGLRAYDLRSGTEFWRYRPATAEAFGFTHDMALAGRRIVVVNERYALGLDLVDGSLVWALGKEDRARFSQPVIAGDVVYFLRDDATLVAHDLDDGRQLLRMPLPQRAREAGPPIPLEDGVAIVDRDWVLRVYR